MSQHTPRPWKLEVLPSGKMAIVGPDGQVICAVDRMHDDHVANAEFIVRVANSHEAMLADLRDSYDALSTVERPYNHPLLVNIRASIARGEARP